MSDVEKERQLQLQCWKKRVEHASKLGVPIKNTYEQCIELPRAIATIDGLPVKGSKANATSVYEKRYRDASEVVVLTSLPNGWAPDTVIIEGMFLINIQPWAGHTTLSDYANFLRKQHMICVTGYGGKSSMKEKWFHQLELYSDTGRGHAGLLTCGSRQTKIKCL